MANKRKNTVKHADTPREIRLKWKYKFAYDLAKPKFNKMKEMKEAYDCNINIDAMPTQSHIPIPTTWNAVEDQLPHALNYLLPKAKWPTFIPRNGNVDPASVRNAEAFTRYQLLKPLALSKMLLLAIKDTIRFSVGYLRVDYQEVSVPKKVQMMASEGGQLIAGPERISNSTKKTIPLIDYIHPISVVPMPDGSDVDGPMRADHFYLDMYSTEEFRDLMKNDDRYSGEVEDIIKDAKSMGYDPELCLMDTMEKMKLEPNRQYASNYADPVIPILVCNELHEKTWLALGKYEIRHIESDEVIMSDLVKFSAWPDGYEWFPSFPMGVSAGISTGSSIWYNAMVDLASYSLRPQRVINKSMMGAGAIPPQAPGVDIDVYGPDAISFLPVPQMPGQLFEMGRFFDNLHGKTNNSPAFMDRGEAGLVRGGKNALDKLLSSTMGRQILAAQILKTGGLVPLIEKVIIATQNTMTGPEEFPVEIYDANAKEYAYETSTVTRSDLLNIFDVEINSPAALFSSTSEFSEKIAIVDRLLKYEELTDIYNAFETLSGDFEWTKYVMKPHEEVMRIQEERAKAQAQAQQVQAQQGVAPERKGQPLTSEAQQATAGAQA